MSKPELVMKACLKAKYFQLTNGDWDLFIRTFGWFQVSKSLTEQEKIEVEKLWKEKAQSNLMPKTTMLQK